MKWYLFMIIILFFVTSITLKADWEWADSQMFYKNSYLYKNRAGANAVATDKNIVVVGSRRALYISYDNGDTWTNIMGYWDADREAFEITGIAIKNNWIFFCTDQEKIFRSSDFGVSWENFQITDPFETWKSIIRFNDIDFDGKILYLNTEMYGVLKSDDFGDSWKYLCKSLPRIFFGGYQSFLRTDSIVYISTLNFGVFFSTDDGESWIEINNGLNLNYPRNIWLGSNIKSNLILLCVNYSILGNNKGKKIVYLLNNDSNNWIEIYSGFRSIGHSPYQFPLLSYEDKIIIAITCNKDTGIVFSSDSGMLWLRKNAGLDYVIDHLAKNNSNSNIFSAICANDKYIFLGINDDRVLYRAPLSDFGITSVDEKISNNDNFSISPNPAWEYIEIRIPSREGAGGVEIKIFNLLGECVLSTVGTGGTHPFVPSQEGNIRIDVSGLTAGVYFIRVGDWVGRFIKI